MRTPSRPSEEIFISEGDRYSRLRLIAWWDQERLAASRVLVAGAGALGNEIVKNLALVGVGELVVADFDRIEITNLSRAVLYRPSDAGRRKAEVAAERAAALNPDVKAVPLHADVRTGLGHGWVRRADVVVGALDNREARLWLNRLCRRTGTPWIDGGIQEIAGQVRVYAPEGACYECGMTEMDYANLNLRYSCPGLRRTDVEEGKIPTTPTIASIVAGLQVQEALKILHGRVPPGSFALAFDGTSNRFYDTALTARADCLAHDRLGDLVTLDLRAAEATPAALFARLRDRIGENPALELDRDLLVALACPACGDAEQVLTPVLLARADRLPCPHCGAERVPETAHRVEAGSPLAEKPLASLGVPPFDVVRVASAGEERHVLLAGDAPGRGVE